MCSNCQASQTGTQQRPLSFGCCPRQALGSPETPGHQVLVLCLQQVPSERTAQGQGDSSGQEERGDLWTSWRKFHWHPQACRGRKESSHESWPLLGGGNEIEREGMGLWGMGLSVTLALAIWVALKKPLYLRSPTSSTGLVIPAAYRYCGESINVNVFEMFGSFSIQKI